MKREFLTGELGLSKEITDKIMAKYGESVNGFKAKVQAAQNENKQLADSIAALNQDVENNMKLCEKVQNLEGEKERLLKELDTVKTELKDSELSGAIVSALSAAGAKNVKAVGALLDKTAVSVDDEGVHGLTEQIDAIKRGNGYLFYDGFMSSGMHHGSQTDVDDDFAHFARTGAKLK